MSALDAFLPPAGESQRGQPPAASPPPTKDIWDNLRWWAAAIASLAWLLVWIYLASARGPGWLGFEFFLYMRWLLASLGLAGLWILVMGVAVRACVAHRLAKARRLAAFLVPFPLAAAILVPLWSSDLPMRVRFELSEGALSNVADHYDTSGESGRSLFDWAGLYEVGHVTQFENCTVIVTGTFFLDQYGFARCSGPPPLTPNYIKLEHLDGAWYTYDHYD